MSILSLQNRYSLIIFKKDLKILSRQDKEKFLHFPIMIHNIISKVKFIYKHYQTVM